MLKPKICIICYSKIRWDSRVLREIESARSQFQVDVIGYGPWQPPENVRFFPMPADLPDKVIRKILLLRGKIQPRYWEELYWLRKDCQSTREILLRENYQLIHANDWDALPVAAKSIEKTGSKLLFDAHEYTPSQVINLIDKILVAPYRDYIMRLYQENIDAVITVSPGLKYLYQKNFGWECQVIMNVANYIKAEYHSANSEKIQFIHIGAAIPARKIEDFIELISLLDKRFILNLLLLPHEKNYLQELKKFAKKKAASRVIFHDPVPPDHIVPFISQFDLSIPLIKAERISYYYALPNKFFQSIMAGLGIITTDLPDMGRIVRDHQIGKISKGFSLETLAHVINSLSVENINTFKQNSLNLAKTLNAETEMVKLMSIYMKLIS